MSSSLEPTAESHCAVKTARMVRRGARLARGKGGRAYSTSATSTFTGTFGRESRWPSGCRDPQRSPHRSGKTPPGKTSPLRRPPASRATSSEGDSLHRKRLAVGACRYVETSWGTLMPKQNGQLKTYELRDLFQQTHSFRPEMPERERGPDFDGCCATFWTLESS